MDIDDITKTEKFESLKSLDTFLYKQFKETTNKKLYNKIIDVYGSYEKAREYFYSKNFFLDNKRPYDLCREGKQEIIYKEMINIEHGDLA